VTGKTRVVGYCRVSTDQQVQEGNGLAYQKRAMEIWCHRNNMELVTTFTDEGVSGGEQIDRRVGLPLAMSACVGPDRLPDHGAQSAAVADGIVVYRLDRLARDMILQEWIIKELGRHEARLFSVQDSEQLMLDDPDDPQRTMMRQIIGAFAQYESQMIRARLMAGKRIKRQHGGYIGGTPPFGTMSIGNGDLEINEDEMIVLNRMIALRETGLGYRRVAEALNAEGYTTRMGCAWSAPRVQQILARTVPALTEFDGEAPPNPWGTKKKRRKKSAAA